MTISDIRCGDRASSIPQRFAAQVRRTPNAIAVVDGNERVTYAELERRANDIAGRLASFGSSFSGRERCVALSSDRSVAAIAGLLGISKAGAAYVPIDTSHPPQRLEAILDDCSAFAVVMDPRAPSPWQPRVPIVSASPEVSGVRGAPDGDGATSRDLAYVLFTSGSTGRPKGVMIEHGSVVNLAEALFETIYERDERPLRVSLNAPLTFDASVQQLVQLFYGHELWIVPEAARRDGERLLAFLQDARIDVLDATPAHLRMLFAAGLQSSHHEWPKRILVGGEALDARMWERIQKSHHPRIYNVYGPTECTVDATMCDVQSGPPTPSIGQPLPGYDVRVLRPDLTPCDEGELGEIWIGGRGVARGYLRNGALTAERFAPDAAAQAAGDRIYRTGDLGRWHAGSIDYVGRADFQVKIRGYRIELGEIETAVRRHASVQDVVVVAHEERHREKRLVAYVVARKGQGPVSDLRAFCHAHLPEYMIPSVVVWLDHLPLGENGKVDRRSLPAPDAERPSLDTEFVPPRQGAETALAELFSKVLRVRPIGARDDFFELGGDSMASLKLVELAQEQGLSLSLRTFLDHPTVAELAERSSSVAPPPPRERAKSDRSSTWLVSEPESNMTRVRLVCFPFAGGNASQFQSWSRSLPAEVQVCAVQLPGRHRRIAQQPMTRMAPLVAALEDAVTRLSDLPMVFFGQCAGGLVGYELARQLRRSGRGSVKHLFVAACPAPEAYAARKSIHALPDETFFAELEQMGGTPTEVLASPELREFAGPALRADLELVETYVYSPEEPLDCPITTFRGAEDSMVSAREMQAWRTHSRGEIAEHTLPGTHYLMDASEYQVLEIIEDTLSGLLSGARADSYMGAS